MEAGTAWVKLVPAWIFPMNRWLLSPLLLLLLACRGEQTAGTPLFKGLESGLSMEEVQQALHVPAEQWQPVDEYHPPRGRAGGLRMQRVELRHFSQGDFDGRLVLNFFNDRLLRTRFHPTDFNRFKRLMAERESLDLSVGKKAALEPATEIRVQRDQEGGSYVVWEDTELQAQWNAVTRRR
jgi:hypothetical protein